jgi:hypothetical protein
MRLKIEQSKFEIHLHHHRREKHHHHHLQRLDNPQSSVPVALPL